MPLVTLLQSRLKTSHQTPTAPMSTSSSTETSPSLLDLHKDATQARLVSQMHNEHGLVYHLGLRRLSWQHLTTTLLRAAESHTWAQLMSKSDLQGGRPPRRRTTRTSSLPCSRRVSRITSLRQASN